MSPTIRRTLEDRLKQVVQETFGVPLEVALEVPPNPDLGDFAAPIGFKLARPLKRPPQEILQELAPRVQEALAPWIESVEIQRGYLNLRLSERALQDQLTHLLADFEAWLPKAAQGRQMLIEFVSANPTGPLNVANARAASVGDTLVRVGRSLGAPVEAEYYVNDGGGQIQALEESIAWHLGERETPPQDGYLGAYLKSYAEQVRNLPYGQRARRVAEAILQDQMAELRAFGVTFDHIVYETEFHDPAEEPRDLNPHIGRRFAYTQQVLEAFRRLKVLREMEGALYLDTTVRGDDKPRVLVRSDGRPTYFLYDIAYHLYKFDRGYELLVDLWGPDHLGHVKRMKIALDLLGEGLGRPEVSGENFLVLIVQQVTLLRGGKRVRMSKRKGEYYTLQDLVQEVGVDAARFFFLLRSISTPLDFDLDLARKLSSENPVYYVQYVHARIHSLMAYAAEKGVQQSAQPSDLALLTAPEERHLLRLLSGFGDLLLDIHERHEPHRLPYALMQLAEGFHAFYQKHRIVGEDPARTRARLALARAVQWVIRHGLGLMGVQAPEKM